jgi:hypothetical protein
MRPRSTGCIAPGRSSGSSLGKAALRVAVVLAWLIRTSLVEAFG